MEDKREFEKLSMQEWVDSDSKNPVSLKDDLRKGAIREMLERFTEDIRENGLDREAIEASFLACYEEGRMFNE